ncbi:MAG: class I SAM-dependent methyltransferase, partial [Chloroflexi bacterium]|nr:class I SAM-dependent methyltransferase [Chloroflexota bacterium]
MNSFNVFDIWERFGITEHPGGIHATRDLLARCGIKPGQRILDIGCGTGYTACLLAREYDARVVAIDLRP